MIGLFGILDMGAHSLEAQQLGTEVTGQNLANVNNPAYARQRVLMQTATDIQTPVGQEGTGVTVVGIQQVRDSMLDSQIASEISTSSSLNAQQLALQDAESGAVREFTIDAQLRDDFAKAAAAHRAEVARTVRGCGAPVLTLRTDRDWIADIVRFVESRRRGALAGRQ